jgi:hypothetical protein
MEREAGREGGEGMMAKTLCLRRAAPVVLGAAMVFASYAACSFDTSVVTDLASRPDAMPDGAAGEARDLPLALEDGPSPDGPKPDALKPDGLQADVAKPDAPADAPKTDAPADAPKADGPRADRPKADAPKADGPKADAPKDTLKPDTLKPDTLKPDTLKPDVTPPFTVTWYLSATSTPGVASCPSGRQAIAGGGSNCPPRTPILALSGSKRFDPATWKIECGQGGTTTGNPTITYVGCTNVTPTRDPSGSCASAAMLGGECECQSGKGSMDSYGPPEVASSKWMCDCWSNTVPTVLSAFCYGLPSGGQLIRVPSSTPTGATNYYANCPTGAFLVSGGCVFPSTVKIVESVPYPRPSSTTGGTSLASWYCEFTNSSTCTSANPCYAVALCYHP